MKRNKLSAVTEIITKGTTPTTVGGDFLARGINFVKAEAIGASRNLDHKVFDFIDQDTHDKLKRSQLKEFDLLVSIAGYLGKMSLVRKVDLPANTNQAVAIVRLDRTKVDPEYIYYYFSQESAQKFIQLQSSQSVQANLNLELLGSLDFLDYPLPTQRRIAAVLSVLDEKIANNIEIISHSEKLATDIYAHWFIQNEFPNASGLPFRTSGGVVNSDPKLLREIPVGWLVSKVSEIAKIESGFPFDSGDYLTAGQYKIITIKNVQDDGLDTLKVNFVNDVPKGVPPHCKLKYGDVLISLTGNVGRVCLVNEEDLLLNQRVGVLSCSDDFRNYLYLHFLRPEVFRRLVNLAGGSAQANLSPIQIAEDYILIPKKEVLIAFNAMVNPLIQNVLMVKNENLHLVALRDNILPMLMHGQLSFK